MAVDFKGEVLLISAHLPHRGRATIELESPMEELSNFLATKKHRVFRGIDANTRLNGMTDFYHVGSQMPKANMLALDRESAKAVHAFVTEQNLIVANT